MGKAVRATRKVRRSQTGQAKKLKKVRVRTTTSPTHFTFFCPQPNSSFLFDFILHFWTLFMCMQAQRMGNYKKRGAAALAPLTAAAGHSGPMSVVAAGWDRTKTAKQNMLAIGLTSDPNADSRHRLSKVRSHTSLDGRRPPSLSL